MIRYLPVQNERLYEKIVGQIETRITSGDLKVGDQLPPERELAEQFEVSRTAVREAIKILRAKGLIEIRSGRGTFVINSSPVSMRQSLGPLIKNTATDGYTALVEVLEIIEPESAALAASRATDEFISVLQAAYTVMEQTDQAELYLEADLDFHLALAEATQNQLIPAMLDSLIDQLQEERMQTARVNGGLKRGQVFHKKILAAVLEHDPQAARLAMKEHLAQIRADMETPVRPTD